MDLNQRQVQFDEEQSVTRAARAEPRASSLTRFIIKMRLAKDNQGAQRVLLIIAVLAIIVALWISFVGVFSTNSESPSSKPIIKSEIPQNIKDKIPPIIYNSLPQKFYLRDIPKSTLDKLPRNL